MAVSLWVEAYRPTSVKEYVFRDNRLKQQVEAWIKSKSIPHILLSGPAGTGKSSLAKVLLNEIGVQPGDVLYINASDQTGVDTVREKIQGFAATIPLGDFKVILLEESDHLSVNGQAALRRIMEDYSEDARFILTCNYANKIIPAIKSRCQEVLLHNLEEEAFRIRMAEILASEGIDCDIEVLDTYMRASYPDLRKCINTMQMNSHDGKLLPPSDEASTSDWQIQAIDMFKSGNISKARKLICDQIRPEEYEDFFKLCYRNLDWWGKKESQQDAALIIVRNALVNHTVCAVPEINLSAMLVELAQIYNS